MTLKRVFLLIDKYILLCYNDVNIIKGGIYMDLIYQSFSESDKRLNYYVICNYPDIWFANRRYNKKKRNAIIRKIQKR